MLPMIKLGGLVARTLTKPLARKIKARSKAHPLLNSVCFRLGQQQHRMTVQLHMGFRNVSTYTIKPLPTDQAVEQGADLVGEILIFAVAVGVASLEYSRSAASACAKEAQQKQQQLQEERAIEERFEYLENHVAWLEERLEEVTTIVQTDMGMQLGLGMAEADCRQDVKPSKDVATSVPRRQDENGYVSLEKDENKTMEVSSYVVKLWKNTYDAVARVFK